MSSVQNVSVRAISLWPRRHQYDDSPRLLVGLFQLETDHVGDRVNRDSRYTRNYTFENAV